MSNVIARLLAGYPLIMSFVVAICTAGNVGCDKSGSATGVAPATQPQSADTSSPRRDDSRRVAAATSAAPNTQSAASTPTAPPAISKPESSFVLVGISKAGSGFIAFIDDVSAEKVSQVAVGDSIAQGTIKSINLDAIEYEAAGKSRRIEIGRNLAGETPAPTGQPLNNELSVTATTAKPPHWNTRYFAVKSLPKMDSPNWTMSKGSVYSLESVTPDQPDGTEMLGVIVVFENKTKEDKKLSFRNVQGVSNFQIECNDQTIQPWETLLGNVYGDYDQLAGKIGLSDKAPKDGENIGKITFGGTFSCTLKPGQQMWIAFMFFVPKGTTEAKLKYNEPEARVIDLDLR